MTTARPTLYEFAGGSEAVDRLVAALHERCLADELLNHPFSHQGDPDHLAHLSSYLAEVFGGPALYSTTLGGQSAMLTLHAGTGAFEEMGTRFVACFMQATDDAALPDDPTFRQALRDYMEWATTDVQQYAPVGAAAPGPLAMPHWSWDGLVNKSN